MLEAYEEMPQVLRDVSVSDVAARCDLWSRDGPAWRGVVRGACSENVTVALLGSHQLGKQHGVAVLDHVEPTLARVGDRREQVAVRA